MEDIIIQAIKNFDLVCIIYHILVVFVCYSLVILAMSIDLIAGIHKANEIGKKNAMLNGKDFKGATTSHGLKMTADKAAKYFLPMICLTLIDMLTCMIIPMPVLTMLWSCYIMWSEFKSVAEKTSKKEELREAVNTMQVVIKNKEDIANVLVETIRKMSDNNNELK